MKLDKELFLHIIKPYTRRCKEKIVMRETTKAIIKQVGILVGIWVISFLLFSLVILLNMLGGTQ